MNCIQIFVLITVNIFLLLKFTGANPVGNVSTRSTDGAIGDTFSSDCDTAHPYCCKPPLYSPSILDLFAQLNTVIDVLNNSCTNTTFKQNVSSYKLLYVTTHYVFTINVASIKRCKIYIG